MNCKIFNSFTVLIGTLAVLTTLHAIFISICIGTKYLPHWSIQRDQMHLEELKRDLDFCLISIFSGQSLVSRGGSMIVTHDGVVPWLNRNVSHLVQSAPSCPESVANFYSPLGSPLHSDNEDSDTESSNKRTKVFRKRSNADCIDVNNLLLSLVRFSIKY